VFALGITLQLSFMEDEHTTGDASALGVSVSRWTLPGWNPLGRYCMNGDSNMSSPLPPSNTIHAQFIDPQGKPAGRSVTDEAATAPDESSNTTARGNRNFWEYIQSLFGVVLPEADH
jgi:hypothetical protein